MENLKEQLEQLFQELVKTKQVKHAVLAVESGDGSFSWAKAEGAAEEGVERIDPANPFFIASVTKLFIAAAVLKLYEQGQLSLKDYITRFLPQQMTSGLHRTKDGTDYSDKITLAHLLSHTSGLPDYIEIKPEGGNNLFDLVLEEGDRSWRIEDSINIVINQGKPLFPPQPLEAKKKKARYSDTNFQLLIAVIEAVSGLPLDRVFEEMFYKPLNLKNTFHPGSKPLATRPPAVPLWYGDQKLEIPQALRSFGDLYSTTEDLIRFLRALISGEVFEDPATAGLMSKEWNRLGFLLSPIAPGWPTEYGYGMMRFQMPRLFTPFQPLPEVIGHTGASGSWLFYCPLYNIYITGTASQLLAAAAPFRLVPKLLKLIGKNY